MHGLSMALTMHVKNWVRKQKTTYLPPHANLITPKDLFLLPTYTALFHLYSIEK